MIFAGYQSAIRSLLVSVVPSLSLIARLLVLLGNVLLILTVSECGCMSDSNATSEPLLDPRGSTEEKLDDCGLDESIPESSGRRDLGTQNPLPSTIYRALSVRVQEY